MLKLPNSVRDVQDFMSKYWMRRIRVYLEDNKSVLLQVRSVTSSGIICWDKFGKVTNLLHSKEGEGFVWHMHTELQKYKATGNFILE